MANFHPVGFILTSRHMLPSMRTMVSLKTEEELRVYLREYKRRAPFEYLRHRLEKKSIDVFRSFVPNDSFVYEVVRRASSYIKIR
jgi:hypothetical protein